MTDSAQEEQNLNPSNGHIVQSLLFGGVANSLTLITYILLIYLCLFVVAVTYTTASEYIEADVQGTLASDQSFLGLVSGQLLSSARNAALGIWDARYGLLIFAALGVFAAGADQFGRALLQRRIWLVSYLCILLILVISFITWMVTQRDAILLWIAEEPEVY
ncbi:MAG: hypothetical protein AAF629_35400, partial [Chloroflexota bacterium]